MPKPHHPPLPNDLGSNTSDSVTSDPGEFPAMGMLQGELEKMLERYFHSLANVDFSQISEEKKASMGLSLLEKLLKWPHG